MENKLFEAATVLNTKSKYHIMGLAAGGSIAYGLNTESSDIDLRGFALPTASEILSLHDFEQQEFREDVDGVVYSLRKLVSLLLACNPNVIELLGVRQEYILVDSPIYVYLRNHKDWFVSRLAANTFGGYATQQLRRIENSMNRENKDKVAENAIRSLEATLRNKDSQYPSLKNSTFSLKELPDQDIRVSGSLNDAKFSELKSFSDLCQSTILNAGNLAARNRKRKNEKLSKHASHLIRLLRMGSEILETGEINTYRENDRDLLLEIKNGKWFHESADGIRSYDDAFWDLLNEEEARFKYAKENTNLPNKPDQKSAKEYVNNIHEVIVIGEADAF